MDKFIAPRTHAYKEMLQYLETTDETELECLLDPALNYTNEKYSQLCQNIQKVKPFGVPDLNFLDKTEKSKNIWDQAAGEAYAYLKSREV